MNLLLASYSDMILSISVGQKNGKKAISKPLFCLCIIEAIENGLLHDNKILFTNEFLRKRFGQLYEEHNHSIQGYELSFFLRPYYHLGSSEFYHLIWIHECFKPKNSNTPSGKYLREHLSHAELDPELWSLLQDSSNREYIKSKISKRFLSER